MTLAQQLQGAKNLMLSQKNPDGSPMFPKGLDNAVLVQNTIRSEISVNTNSTSYQVPILQNSPGVNNNFNINLLSLQDMQVVTSVGVYVAKPSSATDVSSYQLFSWAPVSVFSTSNVASAIIGSYSNGYLRFTNNQQVIAPYWSLSKHYKVPFAQPNTAPFYAANTQPIISSQDGAIDGTFPCQPGWVFNGGGNINMTLNLTAALAAVETYQRFVLIFEGFLLQNASQVK
jgi:hypothetical protein